MFVVIAVAVLLSGASAEADTWVLTTSGGGNYNWTNPSPLGFWIDTTTSPPSGCTYPGGGSCLSGDTVQLPTNNVYTLVVDASLPQPVTLMISGPNFATLQIPSAGTLNLTGNSSVGSGSLIKISGGTLTNASFSTLTLIGGSGLELDSGTLTNNGGDGIVVQGTPSSSALSFRGGTFNGTGSTDILSNASINFSGDFGPMSLNGQTINNSGVALYPPTGAPTPAAYPLSINSGATFNNMSGGFFGDQGAAQPINSDLIGSPLFVNLGSFQVSGSSLTVNLPFNNSGTVSVGGPYAATFAAGGTHTGTFSCAAASGIGFNGSHTFNAGTTMTGAAGAVHVAGGTAMFNTPVTIAGTLINDGSISFGPAATTQTLSAAAYTQSSSGVLNVKLNGPSAGQFDQINLLGSNTLNGGTLSASLGYTPVADGTSWNIMTQASVTGDFSTKNLPAYATGMIEEVPSPPAGTAVTLVAVANPAADLAIGLVTGAPNPVNAAATETWTVNASNNGPNAATSAVINIGLTSGTISSATSSNLAFSCTNTANSAQCTAAGFASGASTTITIVSQAQNAPGTMTLTANISSATVDPNPNNNSGSASATINSSADVFVTQSASPTSIQRGQTATFNVVVGNNGPSPASGITITNSFTGGTFTSVSSTPGTTCGGTGPVICTIASLNVGSRETISLRLTGNTAGTMTNSATAASSNDNVSSNNSASASVTVRASCPTTPTNQQPADGSTNQQTSGLLQWSDVGAASYNVFFGPQGTGCSTQFATTTFVAVRYDNLQGGTTYEWRVEAVTPGCPAQTSSCTKFTTATTCPTTSPTLTSPLNSTVNGPTTFTWSAVAGATSYQLFVNGNLITTTSATSFGPTSVSNGPTTWYVIAQFDACPALMSATGTYNSCDISAAKTIPSIVAQSDAGQTYTLFWDAVASATKYEVDEATDVNFTNPTTLSTTTTSMSFSHPVAVPTAFFYRVRAFIPCANAFGPNSVSVRIVLSPVTALSNPNVSAPSGSDTLIPIVVHVPGFADGSFPFTASLDPQEPWLVRVDPSTGILPPEGINLTVFADPTGLPNGTHTGTVILLVTTPSSGGLAANGTTPVGAPVSISLVTPVAPKPSGTPQANSLIIPSTGHLDGINSRWASDVRILNTSLQTAHYQITFTPDDLSQGVKQTLIQTAAGSTTALDDVVKSWFGVGSLGESSNGSLEIRPLDNPAKTGSDDAPSISFTTVASSRTYNASPTSAAGTLGEFIPAILFQNFVGKAIDSSHAATILSLQQVAQSDAMRTNFGVMEASGQPASVLISVFDSSGNKLLDFPLALAGGQHAQLNGFLAQNHISIPDGRIQAQVVGGDGKITAYASVIDNKSGDPILVSGVPLGQTSANHFVLPGVADLNTGLAAWRTDMRIFNPTSSPQSAQLTFYPANGQGQPQSTSIGINAGEVKQLDNTLQSTFGITNAGGAIHVQTATPQPLVISGRTYNLTNNGTFGQLTTAVTAATAIGQGDKPLQILQTEDSVRDRTNVGIFEVTGQPATVQVSLFLPDSKFSPSTQIPLPANGFIQIPVIQSFGLSNVYNARVMLTVVGGSGKIGAYGSLIDQVTQAPTYIPAQQ